jgi:hypothetical protein
MTALFTCAQLPDHVVVELGQERFMVPNMLGGWDCRRLWRGDQRQLTIQTRTVRRTLEFLGVPVSVRKLRDASAAS